MTNSQATTLDRLSQVEDILEKPTDTAGAAPTTAGLEQSASRLRNVVFLLGDVVKDLHQHATTLAQEGTDQPRTAAAVSALEELSAAMHNALGAAFDVRLAVQDPDRPSKFVDPSSVPAHLLTDDGGTWVRAQPRGEQG